MNASPASETVKSGDVAIFTVDAESEKGFAGSASLTCSGGPAGSVCHLTEPTLTLKADKSAKSAVSIQFPKTSIKGKYKVTFTGTSGAKVETATATFDVKD